MKYNIHSSLICYDGKKKIGLSLRLRDPEIKTLVCFQFVHWPGKDDIYFPLIHDPEKDFSSLAWQKTTQTLSLSLSYVTRIYDFFPLIHDLKKLRLPLYLTRPGKKKTYLLSDPDKDLEKKHASLTLMRPGKNTYSLLSDPDKEHVTFLFIYDPFLHDPEKKHIHSLSHSTRKEDMFLFLSYMTRKKHILFFLLWPGKIQIQSLIRDPEINSLNPPKHLTLEQNKLIINQHWFLLND